MSDEVASLELSKELHGLSKWSEPRDWWHKGSEINGGNYVSSYHRDEYEKALVICPAYTLGYLRKAIIAEINAVDVSDKRKLELYDQLKNTLLRGEDATAELAIQLIKQGVIKP